MLFLKKNSDFLFLKVNILPAKFRVLRIVIEKQTIHSNDELTCTVYSVFWKFLYVSPYFVYVWLKHILKKQYPEFRPTIIHSNLVFPCGVTGSYFSDYFQAKHIISEHWSKVDVIMKHPLFGRKVRQVYKKANAIICVSDFLSQKLKVKTQNPTIFRVPNIVDNSIFHYKPSTDKRINTYKFLVSQFGLTKAIGFNC